MCAFLRVSYCGLALGQDEKLGIKTVQRPTGALASSL